MVMTYDYGSTTNDPNIYIDGSLVSESEGATPDGTAGTNTTDLYIGNNSAATRSFDGLVDEVRISNTILTADWIATEHDNQEDPSTFYSVGQEEAAPFISFAAEEASTLGTGCATGAATWYFHRLGVTVNVLSSKKSLSLDRQT